jgi:hypothetical protein
MALNLHEPMLVYIGGIHRTFTTTSTNQSVDFVNE